MDSFTLNVNTFQFGSFLELGHIIMYLWKLRVRRVRVQRGFYGVRNYLNCLLEGGLSCTQFSVYKFDSPRIFRNRSLIASASVTEKLSHSGIKLKQTHNYYCSSIFYSFSDYVSQQNPLYSNHNIYLSGNQYR